MTREERISRAEIRKDALQEGVVAATAAIGQVTQTVVGAVGEVTRTLGGLATDLFEIRESARRAAKDQPKDI